MAGKMLEPEKEGDGGNARQLTVSAMLKLTLSELRANLRVVVVLLGMAFLATVLLRTSVNLLRGFPDASLAPVGLPGSMLFYLFHVVVVAVAVCHMAGQSLSPKRAIGIVLERASSVIGGALVMVILPRLGDEGVRALFPGEIKFFVLVALWMGFYCIFILVVPVILVEQTHPISAMVRSYNLTRGYRPRIAGALLGITVVMAAMWLIIQSAFLGAWPPVEEIARLGIGIAIELGSEGIMAVLAGVLYLRITGVCVGPDIKEWATVFE